MRYRARRVPCRAEVTILRAGGAPEPGELRDVSLLGGRLAGVAGLSKGDEVRLEAAGSVRSARVCWSRDTLAGLLFGEPLSLRDLRALAGQAGMALAAVPGGSASPQQPWTGRVRAGGQSPSGPAPTALPFGARRTPAARAAAPRAAEASRYARIEAAIASSFAASQPAPMR